MELSRSYLIAERRRTVQLLGMAMGACQLSCKRPGQRTPESPDHAKESSPQLVLYGCTTIVEAQDRGFRGNLYSVLPKLHKIREEWCFPSC